MVKSVSASLYEGCLKKIPEDTKEALRKAGEAESNAGAKKILTMMLKSAHAAETTRRHVCSDAGVPVYFVKIGTAARLEGPIKQAISDGFDHLVATIDPPIEKYVMDCVLKAGSQHCPPVVIGVGIGGTFDHCAKLAKLATLRPYGELNS